MLLMGICTIVFYVLRIGNVVFVAGVDGLAIGIELGPRVAQKSIKVVIELFPIVHNWSRTSYSDEGV